MTAAPTCWIQTYAAPGSVGGAFDLLNPTPEMVDFDAMAKVLARVPRFGAHTDHPYSVAQHCEQGAYAILRDTGRREWAGAFLLHDAHEYLIGDISTPVRDALCALAPYGSYIGKAISDLKAGIDAAIFKAAGLWEALYDSETREVVKIYDIRMLRTERDARLAIPPYAWAAAYERAEPIKGVDCSVWPEALADRMFQQACKDLLPVHFR